MYASLLAVSISISGQKAGKITKLHIKSSASATQCDRAIIAEDADVADISGKIPDSLADSAGIRNVACGLAWGLKPGQDHAIITQLNRRTPFRPIVL